MRKSDLWIPPFHPKQLFAFNCLANEKLYGGSTRGGKSHFVRVAFILWCSRVPNLQADIFRLNLDDVVAECMDGRYSFPDLLAPWEKDGLVTINQREIKFWNKSLISLEHCGTDKVMSKHQGVGKQVRAFLEATQISTDRIRWLRAWCTVTEEMKNTLPDALRTTYPQYTDAQLRNFFPQILYGTNPIGPSAGYFRRHFVNARPRMSIGTAPIEDGGFTRCYIPAKVEDNPSEDKEAVVRRVTGMADAATADALLNENWDAPVGDFFRDYDDIAHTCEDFNPPAAWSKWRAFDWGSSDPFCVLWLCVSDGEEFRDTLTDKDIWFPRGCIVVYREWYGCSTENQAKGIGATNEEIAHGILERTQETTLGFTLSDSLPFQDRGEARNGKKWKMADTFADCGVPLIRGNTDRVFGCAEIRMRLRGKDGDPLLRIARSCKYLREYLPAVQQDPNKREAYVTDGEATHTVDTLRYGVAVRPLVAAQKPTIPPRNSRVSLAPVEILNKIKERKPYVRR